MKIVFFGTPEFAARNLESLNKAPGIEISAVVTQPDKPVGRGKKLTFPPVKVLANQLKLNVLQPKNKDALRRQLTSFKADFFVVIAYGMIIPQGILEMPKIAAINIHASLLPKYRGASPIQESLLHGDEETGISIMQMSSKLDQGDIYLTKRIAIAPNDNFQSLHEKLANLSSQILPSALQDITQGILTPIPQQDSQTSYCSKIRKEDGKIDWNKSAEEIKNMIRAFTPWPSAYTEIKGKKIKILDAEVTEEKFAKGTLTLSNNSVTIGTSSGSLRLKKVQPEGKNPMEIQSFINGYKNVIT